MAANVLIRKQMIRLRTSDEQVALRLRKLLNDTMQHDLRGMMERVFERNASSDMYINMDKLHIDIGTIPEQDFEREFIKQVEPKLVDELRKQLQEYMEPVYAEKNQEDGFYDQPGSVAPSLQLTSAAGQELAALISFLEKGVYPWWYPKKEQKTPDEILGSLPEERLKNLLLKIISIQNSRPIEIVNRIIRRLFIYLPATKHEMVIRSLSGLYNDTTLTTNSESVVHNAALLAAIFSIPERVVFKHLFSFLLLRDDLATADFMINFFRKIVAAENLSVDTIRRNPLVKSGPGSEIESVLATIIKNDEIGSSQISGGQQKDITVNKETVKTAAAKTGSPETDEAIYINNAGLLLLHPFLQYLFTDAGLLTESNQFVSPDAQHKAAVLLYFLQSGNEQYKEWEMPLNKILCGMDQQDVLPDDIFLSDTDKQNCDDLLKAVVNHWEALKGASTEALRNTFLLREGKISRKESHWLVQVERTGADILLDRLPWGYSTIKLPWLSQLILTEW